MNLATLLRGGHAPTLFLAAALVACALIALVVLLDFVADVRDGQ